MNFSGIYKIENQINGKIYIGSAINFRNRRNKHYTELRMGKHCNKYLQRSFKKYGESNFIFSILEYHEIGNLIQREQDYLDFFKPEYNIQKIAGGSNIGVKFTEEHKRKISLANTGRKLTKEQITKISLKLRGRKQSKEEIQKRSESNKKTIYQFDLKGNFVKRWKSAKDVGKELDCSSNMITRCLIGIRPSAFNFIWDFSNILEQTDSRLKVKRIKEIYQLSLEGKLIRKLKSVKEADELLCVQGAVKNIAKVFTGERKTAYGYKWERVYY